MNTLKIFKAVPDIIVAKVIRALDSHLTCGNINIDIDGDLLKQLLNNLNPRNIDKLSFNKIKGIISNLLCEAIKNTNDYNKLPIIMKTICGQIIVECIDFNKPCVKYEHKIQMEAETLSEIIVCSYEYAKLMETNAPISETIINVNILNGMLALLTTAPYKNKIEDNHDTFIVYVGLLFSKNTKDKHIISHIFSETILCNCLSIIEECYPNYVVSNKFISERISNKYKLLEL